MLRARVRLLRLVRVSGVVGAEDAFAVGEGGLEQREGVGEPAGGLVGGGEVVAANCV